MNRLIGAILLITFLNGCAQLPLVSTLEGSLSINGAIAGVTGKYEHQAANALVNMASHEITGKTPSQHLYAAVENKFTKKTLEKHFPDKEISITSFEVSNKSLADVLYHPKNSTLLTPPYKPANLNLFVKTKVKWQGFNYRVSDSSQPNFDTF
jgi:hypothetical protein